MRRRLALSLAVGLLVLGLTVVSSARGWAEDEGVSINFDNADLREVITTISRITGENFLIDPAVKGTVTIVAPQKVPEDQVFAVFQSILELNGYALVESDNVYKVVPTRTAVQKNIPVRIGREPGTQFEPDQLVTQLIPLRYSNAQELSGVLQQLVSRDANMVVNRSTNTIILTDVVSNLNRILGIIREIDVAGYEENITIIPLQYAAADQIADVITNALEAGGDGSIRRLPRRPGQAPEAAIEGERSAVKIIPDQRTNALIVVANEIDTQQVKFLVAELDTERPVGQNNIHVHRLSNALAPDLAETLSSLASAAPPAAAGDEGGAPRVRTFYREVSVVADEATNSLLLVATPQDYKVMREVIDQLDVRRPQVLVEVLIAEVSLDFAKSLGVRWVATFGSRRNEAGFAGVNQIVSDGTVQRSVLPGLQNAVTDLTDLGAVSLALPGALPAGGTIGAVDLDMGALRLFIEANADESDGDFNILSAPHVLTLDNEEAEIIVADSVPFVTGLLSDNTGGGSLAQNQTFEFRDVGIRLQITPHIAPDDTVRMQIHQEVNDVGPAVQAGTTSTLTEIKREVTTVVLVNNRHTIVIGGLITESDRDTVNKVPGLGNVPVFGWLFKSRQQQKIKKNLMVFITPSIVHNLDDSEAVTLEKADEIPPKMSEQLSQSGTIQRSRTFQKPARAPLGGDEAEPLPPGLNEAPPK